MQENKLTSYKEYLIAPLFSKNVEKTEQTKECHNFLLSPKQRDQQNL